MKKYLRIIAALLVYSASSAVSAATLIEVYQQALTSDQIFQQALSQRLADKEGVYISLSSLLPSASITATPTVSDYSASGSAAFIRSYSSRGYNVTLNVSQTVFDYSQYANLANATAISKQADATLNAALQSLMLRVASAYFAVLFDEDNLRYIIANKEAYAKQLDQVKQQYDVGLKTITDVYTAQASYDTAQASYIGAVNTLQDDRENLRVITGVYYPKLNKLNESFPLISPKPENMEEWVATAQRQNWSIKSAQYSAEAARQAVKQQAGGHLPTLQAQGSYNVNFERSITPAAFDVEDQILIAQSQGSINGATATANLVLNIPLVQGGYVVSTTKKAQHIYQVAISALDQQVRDITNTTRQSYLGVLSGISKIQADLQSIKSTISSYEGLEAAYQVGTGTLVDVLNQQKLVVQAQQQYASDRYAYVNNLLTLKSAAGTLSYLDLEAINSWLLRDSDGTASEDSSPAKKISRTRHHATAHHTNKQYTFNTVHKTTLTPKVAMKQ